MTSFDTSSAKPSASARMGAGVTRRGTLGLVLAMAAAGMLPRKARAEELPEGGILTPEGVKLGVAEPFADGMVEALARAMAEQPYAPPAEISPDWKGLTYDQIREIWFDGKHALFGASESPVRAEMFVAGLYQHYPVEIFAVAAGEAREVLFDYDLFVRTDRFPELPETGTGFSGFRLTGEIESKGTFQEYAVFQGATYFRAVAKGQQYGLSARGLALNTASPDQPEEFPLFRRFWIEEGKLHDEEAVVWALMDSPSLTGAYRFAIRKGDVTTMDVEAVVFPRVTLDAVGLAPGTSMFLFNDLNRLAFDDFREGVHDSDGLLVATGSGDLLWRPLANPKSVETSWFGDENPRGFGLMQRARDPGSYNDFAAHYERRPSLWVEPKGAWGKGSVVLVEIPADKEIYDNIVAFWRPEAAMEAGSENRFAYRLHWADGAPPVDGEKARVIASRQGERVFEEGRMFAIDYEAHPSLGTDPSQLEARVTASAGEVTGVLIHRNEDTGGMRVDATLILPPGQAVELRVELWRGGVTMVGEIWLYRWVG
ncbi:glucan biosynthesis protein [Xinfangfangia sp. D13-10-4-6]|uniref:glucan biosynthesis protein n=1 Tax=Pseudogemmobacter hezensis TaxID=2737662 RepID=UPI001554EB99|nr:glucan biosynthesis protein [Pseudogemmobacter hezensis]NPD13760.1 glucan biosynthesis protein [Pseudogemmobacter hezensis]